LEMVSIQYLEAYSGPGPRKYGQRPLHGINSRCMERSRTLACKVEKAEKMMRVPLRRDAVTSRRLAVVEAAQELNRQVKGSASVRHTHMALCWTQSTRTAKKFRNKRMQASGARKGRKELNSATNTLTKLQRDKRVLWAPLEWLVKKQTCNMSRSSDNAKSCIVA
jgi:hypothetical protein